MSAVPQAISDRFEIIPYERRFADQCVEMARETIAASIYGGMPFDGAKVIRQIEEYSASPMFYARMCVAGDVLYGAFIGMAFRAMFCDEILVRDVGWWVRKDLRGGPAALLLLHDFEEWAKMKKAVRILIGQVSGIEVERTAKLYEKCGFNLCGYNASKELGYG